MLPKVKYSAETAIFGRNELIRPKLAGSAESSDSVHLNDQNRTKYSAEKVPKTDSVAHYKICFQSHVALANFNHFVYLT